MKTIITLQDEYIETVNAGHARWSHGPYGGHQRRIKRGAWKRLVFALSRLGFTAEQSKQIVRDADDMAALERDS